MNRRISNTHFWRSIKYLNTFEEDHPRNIHVIYDKYWFSGDIVWSLKFIFPFMSLTWIKKTDTEVTSANHALSKEWNFIIFPFSDAAWAPCFTTNQYGLNNSSRGYYPNSGEKIGILVVSGQYKHWQGHLYSRLPLIILWEENQCCSFDY